MNEALNWLIGAGLFSLMIGFAYREIEAWRGRQRELKGLMYLLDLEVGHNQRSLSVFEEHPDYITQPIGQPIRTATWEDSKARMAQLIKDKDHFGYIVVFYNNLENVMLAAIQTDQVSDADKRAFVSALLPDMKERAQGTRDIIHRYTPPPENEEFGSPFDMSDW